MPALIRQGLRALGQHPRHSALLAALVLLHAVVGGYIGLSVDEAHYLLYAYHPALSYFDHPPLVGWVQWPLVTLDAPVVFLRLAPGLLWLGTVLAYSAALAPLVARVCIPRVHALMGFWFWK